MAESVVVIVPIQVPCKVKPNKSHRHNYQQMKLNTTNKDLPETEIMNTRIRAIETIEELSWHRDVASTCNSAEDGLSLPSPLPVKQLKSRLWIDI